MARADLHIHTAFSDGAASPEQVVEMGLAAGLAVIAVTDHDAVGGVEPALEAAKDRDIEVVPGVELSSYVDEKSCHILGLFIDHLDRNLLEHLDFFREQRFQRGRKIIERLRGLGVKIAIEDVLAVSGDGSMGRPHIAEALRNAGAVATFEDAFREYLGHGRPAYVPKYKIGPADAAEIIHRAGGAAILAHPGIAGVSNRNIMEIMKMGMDGVEVFHPLHERGRSEQLFELADRNGWLISGGSDYHGEGRSPVQVGDFYIEIDQAAKLFEFRNRRARNIVIKNEK